MTDFPDAPHLLHGARAIAAFFGRDAKWFYRLIEKCGDKDSRLPIFKIPGCATWCGDTRDLAAWLDLQRAKAGARNE